MAEKGGTAAFFVWRVQKQRCAAPLLWQLGATNKEEKALRLLMVQSYMAPDRYAQDARAWFEGLLVHTGDPQQSRAGIPAGCKPARRLETMVEATTRGGYPASFFHKSLRYSWCSVLTQLTRYSTGVSL